MMSFTPRSLRIPSHVALWIALAVQAGAINAGGFITCHSFVSHVTGVGTQIGLQLAARNLLTAFELLMVPVSFVGGAMISGLLIDRRRAQGKRPLYSQAMGLIFALLASVAILGHFGYFGEFGEPMVLGRDVLLLSILCFTCGLQNAAISSATRGAIRTTHLTGTLTDLGVNAIKLIYLPRVSKERYRELLINRIRMGTFFAFTLGSALAAIVFTRFEYKGFVLPAMTSLAFFLISRQHEREANRSLVHRTLQAARQAS